MLNDYRVMPYSDFLRTGRNKSSRLVGNGPQQALVVTYAYICNSRTESRFSAKPNFVRSLQYQEGVNCNETSISEINWNTTSLFS